VRLAAGLLRTHVGWRPQQLSLDRQRDLAKIGARQAKIGDMRLALPVDQEIRRLQVAMVQVLVTEYLERHLSSRM
jgi:hypothetical protein